MDQLVQKMRFSDKGFTLPELLLAAAILVFVLAGLLLLFINCIFLNQANRNLTIATSHAQYVLEDVKHTSFDDISTDINNGVWDWDATDITNAGLTALTGESIDTQVSGVDPIGVSVTVSWNDRGLRARNIELRTLITGY